VAQVDVVVGAVLQAARAVRADVVSGAQEGLAREGARSPGSRGDDEEQFVGADCLSADQATQRSWHSGELSADSRVIVICNLCLTLWNVFGGQDGRMLRAFADDLALACWYHLP
jgi:hypothetical protein